MGTTTSRAHNTPLLSIGQLLLDRARIEAAPEDVRFVQLVIGVAADEHGVGVRAYWSGEGVLRLGVLRFGCGGEGGARGGGGPHKSGGDGLHGSVLVVVCHGWA
jgi:hypothetical protein